MAVSEVERPPAAGAEPIAVRAFATGLAVIRAFHADAPRQTLAEVARAAHVSRATARRSLQTLELLGYAANDGRLWSLTPRILELGYAYLSSAPIWTVAEHHLEQLASSLQESATAATLDGDDIIYTARVAVRRIMTMIVEVGTRLPAHASALGRVLLAGLPDEDLARYLGRVQLEALTERTIVDPARLARAIDDVRQDGFCIVDQELQLDVRSVAAPIHDRAGAVVGAIQVCCHTGTMTLDRLRAVVLPEVQRAAAAIDADLRLRPAPTEGSAPIRRMAH